LVLGKKMTKNFEIDYFGKPLSIETDHLAKQANGSVLVKYGHTYVLVTAVAAKSNENSMGYFPLTCLYQVKGYALGKIPGGFLKRESKPSDSETLISRLIDRPIRPLFDKSYQAETQVVATLLSYDPENPPEVAALLGASAALLISDIPFSKPVAGAFVGYIDQKFVLNPGQEEMAKSALNLFMVGTKDAITMVESEAKELDQKIMLEALEFGHKAIQPLIELQEKMAKKVGRAKIEIAPLAYAKEMDKLVRKVVSEPLKKILKVKDKLERYGQMDALKDSLMAEVEGKEWSKDKILEAYEEVKGEIMRKAVVDK